MYLVEEELNSCTMDLRVDADYAYVTDLADVHVGALTHHDKLFKKTIELIARVPNFYAIIGGDGTESCGMHTKGSVFDERSHGYDQVKELRNKLRPIRDKILFVRSGNHGADRAMKNNKMAPEEILADLLDVPYFRGFGAAIVNARKNTYVIGTQHNAKKPQHFGWLHCDAIFYEHLHKQGFERVPVATVNRFTKKWMVRDTLQIQAGSFLSWGGYAKDKGYAPQYTGAPVLELCGIKEQWDMRVYERFEDFTRLVLGERPGKEK